MITNGLVLYLPLYSTDLQGSPIISKDTNAFSCTVTGATWGNQGRTFDGDDFIGIPHSTALQLATRATWEAWVYLTGTTNETIFNKGDTAADPDYIIQLDRTGHSGAISVYNGTGWYDSIDAIFASNTWQHILVSWDGTNIYFYVNGVLKDTVAMGGSLQTSTNSFSLGRQGGTTTNTNYFGGTIGEVLIYNRALTAPEITSNYNETVKTYKACWDFFTYA